MNLLRHLEIVFRRLTEFAKREVLSHRIQYHNPTLRCEHGVTWNYGYRWLDSIQLGTGIYIMSNVEIVVYKHSVYGSFEGGLSIGDRTVVCTGANLRAAGGKILIGADCAISEHCVLVAVNHRVHQGIRFLKSDWDDTKVGVTIGDNVWVGAGAYLLPGTEIGDNVVIGAGSVVRGVVPSNEIWAGVPARKIRDVPTAEEYTRKADLYRAKRLASEEKSAR